MQRSLFGGMISVSLPERFVDISSFRQVPDHQEVFADANTDQSVIVEIVEMANVSDEECASFHYQDLSECSNAIESSIIRQGVIDANEMPLLSADIPKLFVVGRQKVSKFREGPESANTIEVYLCVLRMKHVSADLLIGFNSPLQFAQTSSSKACEVLAPAETKSQLDAFLKSFSIEDMSLGVV